MKSTNRIIAGVLGVSMLCLGLPVAPARAELIATDRVEASRQAETSARERLEALFSRDEVRAGLERYGVDPAEARARVDALSDDEVARVATRLDALPAAGDPIEAALLVGFLAFVILLITDILGFTKVFSFTRPAK